MLSCPGESALHEHKPWGLVHTDVGRHFSTSEETAYPKGLARAIARVFAEVLVFHGWQPPQEQFYQASLQVMRAVANTQPRAAKMPPVVREHRQVVVVVVVVVVKGPLSDLSRAPVEPMQRLNSVYTISASCNASLSVLPEGAQLLRTTPLRSIGGISNILGSHGMAEQAWGIPFTPGEFRGHPKLFPQLFPSVSSAEDNS